MKDILLPFLDSFSFYEIPIVKQSLLVRYNKDPTICKQREGQPTELLCELQKKKSICLGPHEGSPKLDSSGGVCEEK